MRNGKRRVERASKKAIAALGGLGSAENPFVLNSGNVETFIAAVAGCVYQNPETVRYRERQKRRTA